MEKATYKHYGIVIGLLALWLALFSLVDLTPEVEDTANALSLPDTLGPFTAEQIVFCQNLHCQKSMLERDILTAGKCNHCGGGMGIKSPTEENMLPPDTIILRKLYKSPDGTHITASIVIAGKQRTSIHRPQMCLVGQGYSIERQYTDTYDIQAASLLKVSILDLKAPDRPQADLAYAYWFIAKNHSTPYHLERMLITATDNLFKGTSPRWGYVSLMTNKHNIDSHNIDIFAELLSQHLTDNANAHE